MLVDNNLLVSGYSGDSSDKKEKSDEFAKLLQSQSAKDILFEITKDGMKSLWDWQVKQLKKEITEDVMKEMNVTEESMNAMPVEDKVALQKRIMDEVQKRLEVAMAESAQKNRQEGKNELGSQATMVTTPPVGPDKSFVYLTNSVL